MKAKVKGHTPGPWRVERQNPSPTSGEWMIAGGIPGYLAEVRDCGSGDVEANARLIASAPDLLAALDAIVTLLIEQPEYYIYDIEGLARTTIRKATW